MKTYKTISIGDSHGYDNWRHSINYFNENDANDIDLYDYIIFVGDYTDDFTLSNVIIKHNLLEIINLKLKYPEKVILLIGNHDLQYINTLSEENIKKHHCSGFRSEAHMDLHIIFKRYSNLFQMAFQLGNHIWSHAGIHKGWWHYNVGDKKYVIRNGEPDKRFLIPKDLDIATTLNTLYEYNHDRLFDCGFYRGGTCKVGGPFWCDKNELYKKPLKNCHQIIGHTKVKEIKHYDSYDGDTSLTFIDCLDSIIDFYKKDITI